MKTDFTRRGLLRSILALPFIGLLGRLAHARTFEPTPEIPDLDDEPTPPETEGPFFMAKSPERKSLIEKGTKGTHLIVEGTVRDVHGKPQPNALLDFWHSNADGIYDNVGYKLRGHQHADAEGKFRLETIVPGLYPGRTRHIHVKVQKPNGRVLTTQLYFPDEPRNDRDGLFDKRLLMKMGAKEEVKKGAFDFVLAG